jgi:hypothetical protein
MLLLLKTGSMSDAEMFPSVCEYSKRVLKETGVTVFPAGRGCAGLQAGVVKTTQFYAVAQLHRSYCGKQACPAVHAALHK